MEPIGQAVKIMLDIERSTCYSLRPFTETQLEPIPPIEAPTTAAPTPAPVLPPAAPAPALRPMPMRHVLFTYGTMQRGNRNHPRIEGSIPIGKAVTTPRYALWCMGYAPGMTAKGTTAVQGECYIIDDAMLAKVDRAEGTPWKYRRALIHVTLEGGHRMQAWAYILHAEHLDKWDTPIVDGKWVQPKDSHEQWVRRTLVTPRYTIDEVDLWMRDKARRHTHRERTIIEDWDWDDDEGEPFICPECNEHCQSNDLWCTGCGATLDGYEKPKPKKKRVPSGLGRYLRDRRRERGFTCHNCDGGLVWDTHDMMRLCPVCDYDEEGQRLYSLGKSERKILSLPPVEAPAVQAALKAEAEERRAKMRKHGKKPEGK